MEIVGQGFWPVTRRQSRLTPSSVSAHLTYTCAGSSEVTTVMVPEVALRVMVQVMVGRAALDITAWANEETPCTTSGMPVTRLCSAFFWGKRCEHV